MESLLATRSFIARPTDTGYTGVGVLQDGYPSHQLPLLLGAHQYRFTGDLDALSRHLIDEAPDGWFELGTDLLDDTPDSLRAELTGGDECPSTKNDNVWVISVDDTDTSTHTDAASEPEPEGWAVTETSRGDLQWGYVLHPHGIEVIALHTEDRGPVIPWGTDPRVPFSNSTHHWRPRYPIAVTQPPRTSTASLTATTTPAPVTEPQTRPRR